MLEYTNCNLCGSNETSILISRDLSNIVQCKNCSLVYKNPRPAEDEVLKQVISDNLSLRHKKIVWHDAKIRLFKKNLIRIEKYSSKGKMLDIGCGYGTFLKMAKEKSWQTWGVDVSNSAYKYAKETLGLNIFKGILKEAHFPDNYFDVITLWDTLEQLYDPFLELLEINRILKRNGLLLFRVRNVTFHLNIHFLFGNLTKKLGIKPTLFHLYGFSTKTAKMMLEKAGFKNIKAINSELTTGDPYSTGEIFTQFGMRLIKKFTYSLCQLIFYLTGGGLVLGSSMLIFAKKLSR